MRYEGAEYLVAPRGHTQWVKNLRASGKGRLRVGRRTQPFAAVELTDDEKPAVVRAYLKKWKFKSACSLPGSGRTRQTTNCVVSRLITLSFA